MSNFQNESICFNGVCGYYMTKCFDLSNYFGNADKTIDQYVSDELMLKSPLFDSSMRTSSIKFCGVGERFGGIQLFLTDWDDESNTMQLLPIGYTTECDLWRIEEDEFVNLITVGYNSQNINYIKLDTNTGRSYERGVQQRGDSWNAMQFSGSQPFIGVYGFEHGSPPVISQIGFIRYNCRQIFVPDPNATPSGSNQGQSGGTFQGPQDTKPINVNDEAEKGDGEYDNPDYDSNNDGRNDNQGGQSNSSTRRCDVGAIWVSKGDGFGSCEPIESEKSYAVGTIIVCVALLLGVAAGMFFFVIPWYKNRLSEQAKERARKEREAARQANIKGAGQSISTKYSMRGQDPQTDEPTLEELERRAAAERERRRGELADMSDTPSDDDEKDFSKRMRGRSRQDRKRMLKELEQQRQVEIQMHYKMERQQLRHDARMAHQKLGERDRMEGVANAMNVTSATGFGHRSFYSQNTQGAQNATDNAPAEFSGQQRVEILKNNNVAPEDDPEQDPNAVVAQTQKDNLEMHPKSFRRPEEDATVVADTPEQPSYGNHPKGPEDESEPQLI